LYEIFFIHSLPYGVKRIMFRFARLDRLPPYVFATVNKIKMEARQAGEDILDTYRRRRDALIRGLERIGWHIPPPKGTMFVWGKIPEPYAKMGPVAFSEMLIRKARLAVSPGLGFGEYGDDYVRFALIENPMRINQAVRGIKKIL